MTSEFLRQLLQITAAEARGQARLGEMNQQVLASRCAAVSGGRPDH
jgi:hypothetical protein